MVSRDLSLGERARQQAEANFHGREVELRRFVDLISSPDRLPRVLGVHGPPGIGKTAFATACLKTCAEARIGNGILIDSREFLHNLDDFTALVQARLTALGTGAGEKPLVIVVDTFEEMADMEWSFRRGFLETLRGRVLLVLVGRDALTGLRANWPGGEALIDQIELRELPPDQSRRLLESHGVSDGEALDTILGFADGNPLALTVAAELCVRRGLTAFQALTDSGQALNDLLTRMTRDIRDESTRELLAAASVVRSFNEDLLRAMVGDGHIKAFDRLCARSVVEAGPRGWKVHDLARRVVSDNLRWQRPEVYRQLKVSAYRHLAAAKSGNQGTFEDQLELIFLTQETIAQKLLFDDEPALRPELRRATEADLPLIRSLVAEHTLGGSDSQSTGYATLLQKCWETAPERFIVAVGPQGEVVGFCNSVPFNSATFPVVRDDDMFAPYFGTLTAAQFSAFARVPPGGAGEGVMSGHILCRREYPQFASALIRDGVLAMMSETPRIVVITAQKQYQRLALSLGFRQVGWRASVYGSPPTYETFLLELGERGFQGWIQDLLGMADPRPYSRRMPRQDFEDQVKCALEDLHRPGALATSPLRSLGCLAASSGPGALRELLCEVTAQVAASSLAREREAGALLVEYYLERSGSHEKIAERLGLTRTTFYRRLHTGLSLVADVLCEREIGAID